MKTIAITIDENTLHRLDDLLASESLPWRNRSETVREAVKQYLNRMESEAEQERERTIFRRHRALLKRQAAALVKEQAKV